MINRVLIRIKVIQTLYSFLLVESQFNFPGQPTAPTKEKRFAYALYLDMLYLFTRVAEGISKRGGYQPLADTRFIKRLVSDDKMKSLRIKYKGDAFPFESIVKEITDNVKESGVYRFWLKKQETDSFAADPSNIKVWKDLFDLVIMPNPSLNALISRRENFTLRGVERMKGIMEDTFTRFMASQDNIAEAQSLLSRSLDMARELYMRLLSLPVELTDLRMRQIEERRTKYILNEEDLNTNMRMVDNKLVETLRNNEKISNFSEKTRMYDEDPLMVANLLKAVLASDVYRQYIEMPSTDYHEDAEFWRNIFKHVIFRSPDFLEWLEDKSVFWNDDLEIIGTFLLKTLKRFDEEAGIDCVLDKFKDEEDERFGSELLNYVWKNKEAYRDMINDAIHTGSWDTERLAFMDVVVLETALAEILNFPKIPLKASINEYIELAKSYSTAKSGIFVNGVLGTIIKKLREEGKLKTK